MRQTREGKACLMAGKRGTNSFLDTDPLKKGRKQTYGPESETAPADRKASDQRITGGKRPAGRARQLEETVFSQRDPAHRQTAGPRPVHRVEMEQPSGARARPPQTGDAPRREAAASKAQVGNTQQRRTPPPKAKANAAAGTQKPAQKKTSQKAPVQAFDKAESSRPRHSGGRIFLVLMAVLLVLVGMGYLGYTYIRAEEIAVRGNQKRESAYIVALSDIKTGTHIFNVDREKAKKGIEADPYLTLEDIEYTFPNKLTLVVSERRGTACFFFKGVYVVTDFNGFILESVGESERPDLPVIYGINVTEFALGARIRTDDTYKQSVMTGLLEELDKHGLTDQVAEIHLEDVNSLAFALKNGMAANLGQAEQVGDKLVWLAGILPVLEQEGHTGGTIDISSPDMPVYSPPEEAGGQSHQPKGD